MNKKSQMFTVMVIGDNPKELMDKYKFGKTENKYIKYKYLDAAKMKKNSIKILEEIISDPQKFQLTEFQNDCLKERLENLKAQSTLDYYSDLTQGLEIDDEGNAWSYDNPNGKWVTSQIGRNLSVPLVLNEGGETRQALKGDINWNKLHMFNTPLYERVWELVIEHDEPQNDNEKQILLNMSDKENYFSRFKNKEEYVTHNCAYWNYAYLDENGWQDIDSSRLNEKEWIKTYYQKFIEPLNDNDKITIFECSK